MLNLILKNVPYLGSAYSFTKTCNKVYNSTTPAGAISAGVKSIVIDCTPPVIKYPVLCGTLIVCGVACFTSGGNPLVVSATTNIARTIVLED